MVQTIRVTLTNEGALNLYHYFTRQAKDLYDLSQRRGLYVEEMATLIDMQRNLDFMEKAITKLMGEEDAAHPQHDAGPNDVPTQDADESTR